MDMRGMMVLKILLFAVPMLGVVIHVQQQTPAADPAASAQKAERPSPRYCMSETFSGKPPSAKEASGLDYWPGMHGLSLDGSSPYTGPRALAGSLAWQWQHPQGRYYTVLNGVVVDSSSSLYVSGDDRVVKLSPDGATLWTYCTPGGIIAAVPTLWKGAVYVSTTDGLVFALDSTSGKQLWLRKATYAIGGDTHAIAVHDGRLLVPAGPVSTACCGIAGGSVLLCLDAANGTQLWSFKPDAGLWNFHAAFSDDGTFAFQDLEGRAYRSRLADGSLIWKRGGMRGTWNDGSISPGPNGLVYAVTTLGPNLPFTPGVITAYRLEDGQEAWSRLVPTPPNQFPAVGRLGPGRNASVVLGTGTYGPISIYAFDAVTGSSQFSLVGPQPRRSNAAGDDEGFATRTALGNLRTMCQPNAWGNPSIDAAGTVHIGDHAGFILSIRDDNNDGRISTSEVSVFNAGSGVPGSGPALAEGLLAVATCDTLFVFKG